MQNSHSLFLTASLGALSLSFIPSCSRNSNHITKKIIITKKQGKRTEASTSKLLEPPPITIWIHGTRLMRRPLYYSDFEGKPTLKLANLLDKGTHFYKIALALAECDTNKFPLEHFYIFGWSGKLSSAERALSAHALIEQLEPIITQYQEYYHQKPEIRIIAHSHGGNVALNCAKIIKEKSLKTNFYIDELILLACPVQSETRDLITSPCFKKTYAFYSSLDIVQIIAPELMQISSSKTGMLTRQIKIPPISDRRFPFSKELAQVKIKINGHALWHAEFANQAFIEVLPSLLSTVQQWHSQDLQFLVNNNSPILLSAYIK